LKAANHLVEVLDDGQAGLQKLQSSAYDLAIVDQKLASLDGIKVCERYRATGGMTPILILTNARGVADKVDGLDAGADDYLTKPFSQHEFNARARALLLRPPQVHSNTLQIANLQLNLASCTATRNGEE